MGCIVNGPGEMADADFGYVGGAPGKINLYVGKTPVKFNIPEAEAVDRLVELIGEHGKWAEPEASGKAVIRVNSGNWRIIPAGSRRKWKEVDERRGGAHGDSSSAESRDGKRRDSRRPAG